MEGETENAVMPPTKMYHASPADPEGIKAAADLLANAINPAIVCGDGVARAGAVAELVALSELMGAPVYYEGLHHHINFPTHHANCRDRLPADYSGIRKAIGDADTVLLVGGNFFEELWFDEGLPFPESCAVIQVEIAASKIAHNFSVNLGLLGDPKSTLAALSTAVKGATDDSGRKAAATRGEALAKWKTDDLESQAKRAKEVWDAEPIHTSRLMADRR